MTKNEYNELCHELRNVIAIVGASVVRFEAILNKWKERCGEERFIPEGVVE